jgi:uncharacterized membrane protein
MYTWIVLAVTTVLGSWVLGVVGFFRASRALHDLAAMRRVLDIVAARQVEALRAAVPTAPEPPPPPPEPAAPWGEPPPPPPLPPTLPPPPPVDIEALLTQRWGVWVGSSALLLAGVFLVRYAVEHAWLGPAMRCLLAGLLGVALLAAAEWFRRHPAPVLPEPFAADQVPGALAAGGAAVLFGAAYGTGVFYALVPPVVAFALMALAAMVGLFAALRFGQLTAAVGVACAYLTPALTHVPHPSSAGLFTYLLAVTVACLGIVRYTAWIWLGWAAMAGGTAWVCLAGGMDPAAVWAPAGFLVLAAILNLALLPPQALEHDQGRVLAWVPFAALAAAGLVLESAVPGATARAAVLLLSPVAVAKGVFERRLDRLPWVAALAGLLVLAWWALPAWMPTGEPILTEGKVLAVLPGPWAPEQIRPLLLTAALFAAFHAACGLFLELRAPNPLRWAALPAAVPVLTLAALYALTARFQPDMEWAAAALALGAGLTATATRAAKLASRQLAGVHAGGAVAAVLLGCTILLHDHWLTLAFALFLPALAWIAAAAELPQLRRVASAIAWLVLVRLLLNWHLPGYDFGTTPILNGLIAAYAAPAACFAVAALKFRRQGDDGTVRLLEAGAVVLAAAFVTLEIRHAMSDGRWVRPGSFRELGLNLLTLAVQAWCYRFAGARTGRRVFDCAWRILGGLALLVGTLVLPFNPALTNARATSADLMCAYLLPAAIAAAMAPGLPWEPARAWVRRYALLAGFVWIGLQIRALFHPAALGLAAAPVTDAELWCWSGAWLAYGAALMATGVHRVDRRLRLAGLAIIGMVTAKVFLIDMGGLTGLWRVLSFLGLGLALIGLGTIYRRFVLGGGEGRA